VVQAVFPRITMRFRGEDAVPNIVHVHGGTTPTVKTIQHPVQQTDQWLQADGLMSFG